MATFRPPFEAQDIEQLYKKIKRGKFEAIPSQYSLELSEVIAVCLHKKVDRRLSAEELLSLPLFIRKCVDFGIFLQLPKSDSVKLLNTIKISNDPTVSSPKLPVSCYDSEKMKKLTE
jgi:serine/threonine protein kinase